MSQFYVQVDCRNFLRRKRSYSRKVASKMLQKRRLRWPARFRRRRSSEILFSIQVTLVFSMLIRLVLANKQKYRMLDTVSNILYFYICYDCTEIRTLYGQIRRVGRRFPYPEYAIVIPGASESYYLVPLIFRGFWFKCNLLPLIERTPCI